MALTINKYFSLENQRDPVLAEVAGTIREIYPIGLNTLSPEYNQYPGIIKAYEIIGENIGPPEQKPGPYAKIWSSLLKSLRSTNGKRINGTTYGFVPGFSADLILESYEDESLTRTKRIAFAVSLIGPFYSICGVDETSVKEKGDEFGRGYHAINVVTASPFKEFERDFNCIKKLIEEKFLEYKFIPFNACMMHIKDMETPHSAGQDCTVYNALFNHLFNFYNYSFPVLRGDRLYGYDKSKLAKVTLTAPPGNLD